MNEPVGRLDCEAVDEGSVRGWAVNTARQRLDEGATSLVDGADTGGMVALLGKKDVEGTGMEAVAAGSDDNDELRYLCLTLG